MSWFETFSRSFLDFEAMAVVLPTMVMVGSRTP